MKRILACLVIMILLGISYAVIVWAAANLGVQGTRTYKLYDSPTYNQSTGYTKQTGEVQQIARWWDGTANVKDTLCDTIYTDWVNIGKSGNDDLYSIRYITKITKTDTMGNADSADAYSFALQTCMDPNTADSLLFTTVHTMAALADTGTGAWYCPADSVSLYTYWTPYARSRIIITLKIDTLTAFVTELPSVQTNYTPIKYEAWYKPIWR